MHSPIWRSAGCTQGELQVLRVSGNLQPETWHRPQAEMGCSGPTHASSAWVTCPQSQRGRHLGEQQLKQQLRDA